MIRSTEVFAAFFDLFFLDFMLDKLPRLRLGRSGSL